MKHIRILTVSAVLLLSFIAVFGSLSAQDTEVTDNEVNDVAKDIYCPVCENTPLDVCATQACADWRELIRSKLSEGQSREEIFDYFARQYGDGVLANPPSRGVSLVILWVLPIVLVLLGALVFSRYMRKLRVSAATNTPAAPVQTESPEPAVAPKTEDDYIARIEQEVGKS
jgi:cytochrome c-type biogenesis protein CcmH